MGSAPATTSGAGAEARVLRRIGARFERAEMGDHRGDVGVDKPDQRVRGHEHDAGAIGAHALADDVGDLLIRCNAA